MMFLQHSHMGIEVELLEDKSDLCPQFGQIGGVVMDINAADIDLSFGNILQAIDAADQGGFPGS